MDYTAQPMGRKMMREMNQNMLLNLIRAHAPISRTQLKKISGLSLATIMGMTAALIEQQLVVEVAALVVVELRDVSREENRRRGEEVGRVFIAFNRAELHAFEQRRRIAELTAGDARLEKAAAVA